MLSGGGLCDPSHDLLIDGVVEGGEAAEDGGAEGADVFDEVGGGVADAEAGHGVGF